MGREIKRLYDQANKCGMKPFIFDTQIMQYDVFDKLNGKITKLNQHKYKTAAKKILREYKNV